VLFSLSDCYGGFGPLEEACSLKFDVLLSEGCD
jgi:hypothetical protein